MLAIHLFSSRIIIDLSLYQRHNHAVPLPSPPITEVQCQIEKATQFPQSEPVVRKCSHILKTLHQLSDNRLLCL